MIGRMFRRSAWFVLALVLFAAWQWWAGRPAAAPDVRPASVPGERSDGRVRPDAPAQDGRSDALPPEARATLRRILAGGPHPYRQDGSVFHNRERLLPPRARGWYREYTVDTPGEEDRGARRIVTGGRPPAEFWYTADHYRSFRRIDPAAVHAR